MDAALLEQKGDLTLKLKIIAYFWAAGHRTKRKGSHKLPLVEGETRTINHANFKIDKVEDDKAIVSINRDDGTLIKELTIEIGEQNYYRPMSMDAGYEYILKLTRF